jgi:hypothetical protein
VAELDLVRSMRSLILLTVLFTGCAAPVQGYRIVGGARHDIPKVKRIMRDVAAQGGLAEESDEMRDHVAFVSYQARGVYMRGDTYHTGNIYVTLVRNQEQEPPTSAFKKTQRLLGPALLQAFGSRFSVEQWTRERGIEIR